MNIRKVLLFLALFVTFGQIAMAQGTIFRIQIGAFGLEKDVQSDPYFNGLAGGTEIEIEEVADPASAVKYRYYAGGAFGQYGEASQFLNSISNAYKDAFIVAFIDESVPAAADEPLTMPLPEGSCVPRAVEGFLPADIVYRVQIGAFSKVKDIQTDTFFDGLTTDTEVEIEELGAGSSTKYRYYAGGPLYDYYDANGYADALQVFYQGAFVVGFGTDNYRLGKVEESMKRKLCLE